MAIVLLALGQCFKDKATLTSDEGITQKAI